MGRLDDERQALPWGKHGLHRREMPRLGKNLPLSSRRGYVGAPEMLMRSKTPKNTGLLSLWSEARKKIIVHTSA